MRRRRRDRHSFCEYYRYWYDNLYERDQDVIRAVCWECGNLYRSSGEMWRCYFDTCEVRTCSGSLWVIRNRKDVSYFKDLAKVDSDVRRSMLQALKLAKKLKTNEQR